MSSSGIKPRKQSMGFMSINEYIIMVRRMMWICMPRWNWMKKPHH